MKITSVLILVLCLTPSSSMGPVVIHGKYLYHSESDDRFTCRGVTVSPVSVEHPQTNQIDHFLDSKEHKWRPIVDALKGLNVNCVRIYQVCNIQDPEIVHPNKSINAVPPPECGSHRKFMNALEELGIYAVIPVISGPPYNSNIVKGEIPAPSCYSGKRGKALLQTAAARVSEFAQYNNTLAFNVGNELALYSLKEALPAQIGVFSYPCVKALSRDLKAFMKKKRMRSVPTLYAMQDPAGGPVSMKPQMRYLACSQAGDSSDTVDILGLNSYAWCKRNYTYDLVYERYVNDLPSNLDKPVMLTEFGCTGGEKELGEKNAYTSVYPWTENYRTWEQVPSIFNESQMGARYSGAFAYDLVMYAELKKWQKQGERISESYGLIATRDADNVEEDQDDIVKLPAYYALSNRYKQIKKTYSNVEYNVPKEYNNIMTCGEKLSDENMTKWLWNYFLVDRATNEKNEWWDDLAANYLATGSMPPNPNKNHFTIIVAALIAGFLSYIVFVVKKKMNHAPTDDTSPLISIEGVDQKKEDDTAGTYGSFSEHSDIEI